MSIILYAYKNCLFCQQIRIILNEKKTISYETILLTGDDNEDKRILRDLKVSNHKPPIIIDRTETFYDSDIITLYLEERYPVPKLMASQVEMIQTRLAMHRIKKDWYSLLFEAKEHFKKNNKTELKEVLKTFEHSLKRIDNIFNEFEYFNSNIFTLADIMFCVLLYHFEKIGMDLDKVPNIKKYSERIFVRDSFQKVLFNKRKKKLNK